MSSVKRHWPIIILALMEIFLVAVNYKHGTFLMGWDNVMPEFDFRHALATNIFGVWQEHRGLGLYDGMGHAANLVHTIFLWLLSLAIPASLLRYIFTFLMHLLGGIGAYVLLKKVIDNFNATALSLSISRWIALAGALFYQYNLATIQMFYTPLEAFSVHFAALPWLAWGLLGYLTQPSRKTFFLFLTISLLSTPQFFIPTLLLPVGILLGSITLFTFTQESVLRTQDTLLKKPITAFVGFLLINAFWLLPYVYGLPRNAPIIQAAKINQMSSDEVFARNQAFGGLSDVLRLRGFPLDFEDTDEAGTTTFLMAPWREFLQLPFVTLGSWFLVAITILGIGMNGFLAPFIASLLFMANDTAIIKEGTEALRLAVPMLAEAYRFPFTKFSLLFALSSSVLFSFGLSRVTKTRIVPIAVIGLIVLLASPTFRGHFFSDRLRVALPDDYPRVFAFMNDKPLGRVAYLPQHQYWSWKYYQWGYRGSGFFWYGLPQPILDRAFDPWSGYNENYYWEISRSIYSKDAQSLLSVLAKYDVRYVLLDEHIISPSHNRALFTEEIKVMLAGMPEIRETAKFGKLTLYERAGASQSFISLSPALPLVFPSYRWTDNDIAYRELGDYINEPGGYTYPFRSLFTKRSTDEREFEVEEKENTIIIRSLLLHNPGSVTAKKKMYEQKNANKKDPVNNPGVQIQVNKIDLREVYHTLFPSHVIASENDTHEPNDYSDERINNNKFYGIGIHNQNERSSSQIAAISDTIPSNKLVVKTVDQSPRPENTVGNITIDPTQPAERLVNNPDNTRVTDRDFSTDITTTVAGDTFRVNIIIPKFNSVVYDSTKSGDLVAENVQPCGVLREGTATAQNTDLYLRFTSRNQRGCLSFGVGNLTHRDGYLVAVESRHIAGRPLLFSLINQTAKHVELETYLTVFGHPEREKRVEGSRWQTDYFVLPPLANDGLGYTVYLSNDAIGPASAKATAGEGQESVNDIKSIKFYRIPYQEMVTMKYSTQTLDSRFRGNDIVNVDHPNPAYYLAKLDPAPQGNQTLVLSQSFDPGWKAYVVNVKCQMSNVKCSRTEEFIEKIQQTLPFLFGTEIKDHVLVNNWANGWRLNSQSTNPNIQQGMKNCIGDCVLDIGYSTIVLFFLPQLLQWMGFLLLPFPFLFALRVKN